jgi:hypothetical protein
MKITLPKEEYDLKIYICGIGYQTRHEEIFRACDGWIGHIDGMIWGDGRFDFFPSDKDYSTNGWLEAAEKRYKDKCHFIGYQYSGRQVDKRQKYLDIAGKNKVDVLIAVDTEEYIDPDYSDFETFYRNIARIRKYSPTDKVLYQWIYIPSSKLWHKQGNKFKSNRWLKSAKIHIDPGKMRFCLQKHFVWCKKNKTDQQLLKWQLKHRGQTNPWQYHPRLVVEGVRIRMDRKLRDPEFSKKVRLWGKLNQHAENSEEYYEVVKATGYPDPPPGYTWDMWAKKPHFFDLPSGQRVERNDPLFNINLELTKRGLRNRTLITK